MEKILVLAYGTMKEGCQRDISSYFDAKKIGITTINDKILKVTSNLYPIIVDKKDSVVIAEVYEVNEDCLPLMDLMEGVDKGLYKRAYIEYQGRQALYYEWTYEHPFYSLCETCNWEEEIVRKKDSIDD